MTASKPPVDVLFGTAYSHDRGDWKVCVQFGGQSHYGESTYESERDALAAMADVVELSTVLVEAVTGKGPDEVHQIDN